MDIKQKFQIGQKVCFWNSRDRIIEGIVVGVSRQHSHKAPQYEIAFPLGGNSISVTSTGVGVFSSLQELLNYHTQNIVRLTDRHLSIIHNKFCAHDYDIVDAEVITDYILKIEFANGESRTIDFGDYIRSSENPLIKQYADKEKFGKFKIDDGVLTWNNNMDFDPEALLKGTISGLQYINNTRDDD